MDDYQKIIANFDSLKTYISITATTIKQIHLLFIQLL
jgi:hypothetical protein